MGKKKKKKNLPKEKRESWKRSIDLHGMRVDEAIAELDRFINQCILDDEVYRVEVVHGIGTGRVKAAVLAYLKGLSVVRKFESDAHNPGATWVEF